MSKIKEIGEVILLVVTLPIMAVFFFFGAWVNRRRK